MTIVKFYCATLLYIKECVEDNFNLLQCKQKLAKVVALHKL